MPEIRLCDVTCPQLVEDKAAAPLTYDAFEAVGELIRESCMADSPYLRNITLEYLNAGNLLPLWGFFPQTSRPGLTAILYRMQVAAAKVCDC